MYGTKNITYYKLVLLFNVIEIRCSFNTFVFKQYWNYKIRKSGLREKSMGQFYYEYVRKMNLKLIQKLYWITRSEWTELEGS